MAAAITAALLPKMPLPSDTGAFAAAALAFASSAAALSITGLQERQHLRFTSWFFTQKPFSTAFAQLASGPNFAFSECSRSWCTSQHVLQQISAMDSSSHLPAFAAAAHVFHGVVA